jgi:hypothetical protein
MAVGSFRGPGVGLVMLVSFFFSHAESSCIDAGYTNELRCSTCDALDDFLGADSQLCTTCRLCCTKDAEPKFVSARIEVCK